MNSFQKDENNEEVLLSSENQQVMMEWEKPYMEKSIDFLQPFGDVLEIGFGCGYSATQIMKFPIKSYTIVECDPIVINKIVEWSKNYPNIPINIIKGQWQAKINSLGIFDSIYFDDFPLEIKENSQNLQVAISNKRLNIFLDLCIQNHTRLGSKFCCYLNANKELTLPSDTEPFVTIKYKKIDITIPESCKYRNIKEQSCLIPVITKIKEYNFEYANKLSLQKIMEKFKN